MGHGGKDWVASTVFPIKKNGTAKKRKGCELLFSVSSQEKNEKTFSQ
jgi:hypothetical protein